MKKKIVALLLLVSLVVICFASCGYQNPYEDREFTHYADIKIKNYGTITLALDGKTAPITVENFVNLAQSGFYDGLTFHRIMEGFMMQGGDPNGNGSGDSGKDIFGEFSNNGHQNDISHKRGVVSMARGGSQYADYLYYNTGSCQFFIVHEDSEFLDGNYAAFGWVLDGMNIVDKICRRARPTDSNGTIPSSKQPVIETITIRENN